MRLTAALNMRMTAVWPFNVSLRPLPSAEMLPLELVLNPRKEMTDVATKPPKTRMKRMAKGIS